MAYRLPLVRRGALGSLQLLDILRTQHRWIERDGHFVDRAGEFERHLVVLVVHRIGAAAADVERLVERLDRWKGMLQRLSGHDLPVHLKRSGASPADTAHIVVRERPWSESVVLEVILDSMFAGGQDIRSFKAGPLQV